MQLNKFDALVNGGNCVSAPAMTASLPAEIKARRQQYEYYRNKLLNFEPRHCEGGTTEAIRKKQLNN
ncbi:MAG: hypothetical protein LBG96_04715 [Tannerella sp.]|nr:hypothetical protein [Tannerella sp.]